MQIAPKDFGEKKINKIREMRYSILLQMTRADQVPLKDTTTTTCGRILFFFALPASLNI
jgi:hypothetical protein